MSFSPHLLLADACGNIFDDPGLSMLCDRAGSWSMPDPAELIPLPDESELFMLPGRLAVGFDAHRGEIKMREAFAVAAFIAPGHTISATPAYKQNPDAPMLPLFAYAAVGYAKGQYWVCARKVDPDERQRFSNIKPGRIEKWCSTLLAHYPDNRLIGHIINNCVRRYGCPAARNFALGRYEAPLPTSRSCNAKCLGCISLQGSDSPVTITPQCRLAFTPEVNEIVEVMSIHEKREKRRPIYSFGQGCEGDPLQNAPLLVDSIAAFRKKGGSGTINCNTNASDPAAVAALAAAGLTSLRVSLNSARPGLYAAYYRPQNYDFNTVIDAMRTARKSGVYVSINLLFFPGITDTRPELEALSALCRECGVSMIQMRNLNIDPHWYPESLGLVGKEEAALGLTRLMHELRQSCPWLKFGYFNPYLGTRASIPAPLPV